MMNEHNPVRCPFCENEMSYVEIQGGIPSCKFVCSCGAMSPVRATRAAAMEAVNIPRMMSAVEVEQLRAENERYQSIEKGLQGITLEEFADMCKSTVARYDGGQYRGGRILTGEDAERYYTAIGNDANRYDALLAEVKRSRAECNQREADIKYIGKICADRYDKIAELTAENVRLQIELDKTKRGMERAIRILQPAPNKEEDLIIGRDCRCDNCAYDGNRADRRKVRCSKGIDGTNGCGLWEPRPERND